MRNRFTAFSSCLRKNLLGLAFGAATLAAAGLGGSPAQAGVAGPTLGTAVPSIQLTENVRWVCGVWHCWWRPNWTYGVVPPYARAWGPPDRPGCFWRRNWGGGWSHICP